MTDLHTVQAELSAEDARQLTDRIKVAVDGTWLLIQQAYTARAWLALGYTSWDDYCTREFGASRLRLPREERQEVVASLREIGMSTRAIAAATGVSQDTVRRNLAGERNRSPAQSDDAITHRPIAEVEADMRDPDAWGEPVESPSVRGTDGKTYPSAPARPTPRTALPPAFASAVSAVSRAVARIEQLSADDRFKANRNTIAELCLPEVRRAAEVLQSLSDDLS